MKKKVIGFLLSFVMLINIAIPACASSQASDDSTDFSDNTSQLSDISNPENSDEEVASTEDNSTIYYVISSLKHGAEIRTTNLEEQNEYESYRIDMFTNNDNLRFRQDNAMILSSNSNLLNDDASVSFNPKDINPDSIIDEKIELPIFTSDQMYQTYVEARESGNIAIPRQISANIFINEIDKDSNTDPTPRDGIIGQRSFTYCVAYVSTVDEYNSGRTRKRHNVGFSLEQKNPNYTAKYISTTKYDNKPDILGLAWSIGGATTSGASTTTAQAIYSYQSNDMIYQNYQNKSQMTAHNSYCTGNGVGFEVPDTMLSNDSAYRTCYPSLYSLGCTTGWYDVGSYNGATGYLKGSLYHTFQNKRLYITPSISLGGISFSISGGTESDLEVGWAEGLLSPY